LEACLGVSHHAPGYRSYAVAQTFDPNYPNMALVMVIARRISDGALAPMSRVVYSPKLDNAFSYTVLPILHAAFNCVDPTANHRSLLVQSYNARLTWSDLIPATVATFRLMRRFKQDGQLAQIAVDFDDPLIRAVATMTGAFSRWDICNIPRARQRSAIGIPLRGPHGTLCEIRESSTALDRGISLAREYLDAHYRRSPAPVRAADITRDPI